MLDPVKTLRNYINIRTDHPNPDYQRAITFLENVCKQLNLDTQIVKLRKYNALLVTLKGSSPDLKPIILNSHIDVVPVQDDCWNYNPWGTIDNDKLYGRGTQDMKSIGIMYLFTMYKLAQSGVSRTIISTFVPDEEIMGTEGMYQLINILPAVEFALDEGLPSSNNCMTLFYAERLSWWLKITACGDTGHGSSYVKRHSIRILNDALSDIFTLQVLDNVTININYLHSGYSEFYNVIPTTAEAGIDIRLSPSCNLDEFKAKLDAIFAKHNISYEFQCGTELDHMINPITDINHWCVKTLQETLKECGITNELKIFQATTDAMYFRKRDIPTIGISPIRNTKMLLHDHDEYIPIECISEGIDIYYKFLSKVTTT